MTRHSLPLAFVLPLALALGACAHDTSSDEEIATASASSALQATRSGGVGQITVEHLDPITARDADSACQAGAALPPALVYPATCAVRTCTGRTMHVQMTDCTGPFGKGPAGKSHVSGGLDATFSHGADGKLHLDVKDSGDLTGNGRPIAYTAGADITTAADGNLDVVWSAHWTGTTRRGRGVDHTSSLNIQASKATGCLDIVGTAHATVGRVVDISTQIDKLAACPGVCPSGAIHVTRTGPRKSRTMDVTFDGTTNAHVVVSDGRKFDIAMACDADENTDL